MRPEPLVAAIESVRRPASRVMLLSPTGPTLHPADRRTSWPPNAHLVLVCGRYEGVDERVRLATGAEELSIGDFVLTGGELAAMVVLDAVIRLLPGVLSSSDAWRDESHSLEGLLEYPQYTRPVEFRGLRVPDVLLSGHHARSPPGAAARRWSARASGGPSCSRPSSWPSSSDLTLANAMAELQFVSLMSSNALGFCRELIAHLSGRMGLAACCATSRGKSPSGGSIAARRTWAWCAACSTCWQSIAASSPAWTCWPRR